MTARPAVFWFTASAEATARRAAAALGGEALSPEGAGVAETLRAFFAAGRPIVGVCATGVLIRAMASMIGSKREDPPVVALAEDGSTAIPLLGGHRGANAMATRLAEAFGGVAALTTAGELRLGLALDAPPEGWVLENPEDAKAAMAALLAGAPARLEGEADWLAPIAEGASGDGPARLHVEGAPTLTYWRRVLALGVGCARGCPPEEMAALVDAALAEAGRSRFEIARIGSIDVKADEAAIHALARPLGLHAEFFRAATLEAQAGRLANPSETVFAEVGCHGVAEGAALTMAGEDATLLVEKRKSRNATCALAEIAGPAPRGRPRGRLSVVGIGPGAADWRTPEASRLIAEAEELVGYGLYIDLLGPLAKGKRRSDFPLGGEEARCRHALETAAEGRNVALICSGDAGIYAMGALVMELMARDASEGGVSEAAKRVEVVNAPGVTAMQAASARIGALLGHDFCAISLSDLLTPREDIMKRLRAAAEGDFVIAFYNPVSKRRRALLAEAREILLAHRPAETPVLLAASLGRPEERLTRRTLATLEVDEVDMLTVVLVGSSQSRAFRTGDLSAGAEGWRMFTPRGYAKKMEGGE